MNWVDMLFLVILAAGLLWGMQRGIAAQLISLLSLFLAVVLALLFYTDLAALLRPVLHGVSRQGLDTIAFLFLLVALSNVINYAVRASTIPPEGRRRDPAPGVTELEAALADGANRFILAPITMLGSMALALVLTCVWFGVASSVLRDSLLHPWLAYDGIRAFLYHGLGGSTVVSLLNGAFREAYPSVVPLISEELGSPLMALIRRFNELPL